MMNRPAPEGGPPMANARLEVNDGLGQRVVPITKAQLCIGRRTESDLRLVGSDVSRATASK